jgi:hypothetical protein
MSDNDCPSCEPIESEDDSQDFCDLIVGYNDTKEMEEILRNSDTITALVKEQLAPRSTCIWKRKKNGEELAIFRPPLSTEATAIKTFNIACKIHEMPFMFFCTRCQTPICKICQKDSHLEHMFVTCDYIYEERVKILITKHNLNIDLINNFVKNYNDALQKCYINRNEFAVKVKRFEDEFNKEIGLIHDFFDEPLVCADPKLNAAKNAIETFLAKVDEFENLLESMTASDVVEKCDEMLDYLEKQKTEIVTTETPSTFEISS